MAIAAARAIADAVGVDKVNASFIVPSVFDATVAPAVAAAVRAAAKASAEGGPATEFETATDFETRTA
jgi:malate dehydrogenase (oxaloacetate-decarboxylating)